MPRSSAAPVGSNNEVELCSYFDGSTTDEFTFARFYWERAGSPRAGILPLFVAKCRPAASASDGPTAARVDVLLPADAPQDYTELDFLVRRFEETLPESETIAFVQLTMRFPNAANLHHPFEVVRAWVRETYVQAKQLPALLVLHAPHLNASDNPGHCHALILPRRLTRLGWAGIERNIGNDVARTEARAGWEAFREPEMER